MDSCERFVQHVYFLSICFGHLVTVTGIMGHLYENNREVT